MDANNLHRLRNNTAVAHKYKKSHFRKKIPERSPTPGTLKLRFLGLDFWVWTALPVTGDIVCSVVSVSQGLPLKILHRFQFFVVT